MKLRKTLGITAVTVALAATGSAASIPGTAGVNIFDDLIDPAYPGAGNQDAILATADYDGAGDLPAGVLVLTADNEYILDRPLFVEDGTQLIIEPGTKIYSTYNDNGANANPLDNDDNDPTNDDYGSIVVARGGKIIAEGTADAPIIFTTVYERDGLDQDGDGLGDGVNSPQAGENFGLWGGIVLLGEAPVTDSAGVGNDGLKQIEGFSTDNNDPRLIFGADILNGGQFNPEDSSGILRYVSIRFGGYEFESGSEINGLTLGGVGRGTTLDHIEVVSNNDDGFEWFGGTVNAKHLAAVFCDDDSMDIDNGFQGINQYVFVLQGSGAALGNNDRAGEHDGKKDDGSDASQLTSPRFFNATYIGSKSDAANSTLAFRLRESFAGQYHNSLFMDFKTGIDIGLGDGQESGLTEDRVQEGRLRIENSSWWNIANQTGHIAADQDGAGNKPFAEEKALFEGNYSTDLANDVAPLDFTGSNTLEFSLPVKGISRVAQSGALDPTLADNSTLWVHNGATLTNPEDALEDAVTNAALPNQKGIIERAPYRGAFGKDNWLSGWTYLSENGFLAEPAQSAVASRPRVNIYSDIIDPAAPGDAIRSDVDYDGAGPLPTGVVVLSSDNNYVLDKPLFVETGATLIIEPGTWILNTYNDNGADADPNNNDDNDRTNDDYGSIVVAVGGTLVAEGNPSAPIVMTSIYEVDGLDTDGDGIGDGQSFPQAGQNFGLFGGLVLLGDAPVTDSAGVGNDGLKQIEGFSTDNNDPRLIFGADILNGGEFDSYDSSGLVKYFSVRFGGYEFESGSEINGVTLGGVGLGTAISHVEVVSNNDDGFEWFGGNVNGDHLITYFCDDDSMDIDNGYQGTNQHVLVLQGNGALNNGDRGGEHDGKKDDGSNLAQLTSPKFLNATYIGATRDASTSTLAFRLRESFAGQYHNSIFADFKTGIDIGLGDGQESGLTEARVRDGQLRFENNTWFNVLNKTGHIAADQDGAGNKPFAEEKALFEGNYATDLANDVAPSDFSGSNNIAFVSPVISFERDSSFNPTLPINSSEWVFNGATVTALSSLSDTPNQCSNFGASCYRGAFGLADWTGGWSYLSTKAFASNVTLGDAFVALPAYTAGGNAFTFETVDGSGLTYTVEFSATLEANSWDPVTASEATVTEGSPNVFTVTPTESANQLFFRVVAQ